MKIIFKPGQNGDKEKKFKKPKEHPGFPFKGPSQDEQLEEENKGKSAVTGEKPVEKQEEQVEQEQQNHVANEEKQQDVNSRNPGYPDYPDYPQYPGYPGEHPSHPDYPDQCPGCPDYPEYPGHPGYPDHPGHDNPQYPGCPDDGHHPGYPDYPEYPDHPGQPSPGHPGDPCHDSGYRCGPYPFPGYYYPLQCLGYAYIPWQVYWRKYSPAEAHDKGTLFPELYSPYFPDRKPPVVPIPYLNRRPPMLRKKKS